MLDLCTILDGSLETMTDFGSYPSLDPRHISQIQSVYLPNIGCQWLTFACSFQMIIPARCQSDTQVSPLPAVKGGGARAQALAVSCGLKRFKFQWWPPRTGIFNGSQDQNWDEFGIKNELQTTKIHLVFEGFLPLAEALPSPLRGRQKGPNGPKHRKNEATGLVNWQIHSISFEFLVDKEKGRF